METRSSFNLTVTVNGQAWSGEVSIEETLLEFLRQRLHLTGTKRSCESEVCGACTVLVDDRAVSACNYLAFEAHGKSVLTIEGVARGDELDPLQEAFIRNIGAQCGYCTPGQIMAAKALLMENPNPSARADRRVVERQHLPLRRLWRHRAIDSRSGAGESGEEGKTVRCGRGRCSNDRSQTSEISSQQKRGEKIHE